MVCKEGKHDTRRKAIQLMDEWNRGATKRDCTLTTEADGYLVSIAFVVVVGV